MAKQVFPSSRALFHESPGQSEGDVSVMFPEILNQSRPQSLVLISIDLFHIRGLVHPVTDIHGCG